MKKKDDLKFEEAIQELEEIAEKLEKGQISLEESIQAYERGVELKTICIQRLKEAESRIDILSVSPDGIPKKEQIINKSKPSENPILEELF